MKILNNLEVGDHYYILDKDTCQCRRITIVDHKEVNPNQIYIKAWRESFDNEPDHKIFIDYYRLFTPTLDIQWLSEQFQYIEQDITPFLDIIYRYGKDF